MQRRSRSRIRRPDGSPRQSLRPSKNKRIYAYLRPLPLRSKLISSLNFLVPLFGTAVFGVGVPSLLHESIALLCRFQIHCQSISVIIRTNKRAKFAGAISASPRFPNSPFHPGHTKQRRPTECVQVGFAFRIRQCLAHLAAHTRHLASLAPESLAAMLRLRPRRHCPMYPTVPPCPKWVEGTTLRLAVVGLVITILKHQTRRVLLN